MDRHQQHADATRQQQRCGVSAHRQQGGSAASSSPALPNAKGEADMLGHRVPVAMLADAAAFASCSAELANAISSYMRLM